MTPEEDKARVDALERTDCPNCHGPTIFAALDLSRFCEHCEQYHWLLEIGGYWDGYARRGLESQARIEALEAMLRRGVELPPDKRLAWWTDAKALLGEER